MLTSALNCDSDYVYSKTLIPRVIFKRNAKCIKRETQLNVAVNFIPAAVLIRLSTWYTVLLGITLQLFKK